MLGIKQKYINLFYLSGLMSNSVVAADVDYFLGVSAAHFSNFNLVAEPLAESESSLNLNIGAGISEDSANLFVDVDASLQSIKYQNELAADENVVNLLADIIWRIRPGQYEWILTNNFAQTAIDTTASDTVNNRQNVNALSTGPNYTIRLNPRNDIRFEARAENYSFEENLDNNRVSLAGRWIHNMNSALIVTLNDLIESTNFEDNINIDFNRNDVFFGVNYERGVNTFDAEYGVTYINNDGSADFDGGRYALAFTNARTRSSSIRFSYENLLSDTGNEILNLTADDSVNNTVANDIFVAESFRFQYLNTLSTGNISFDISSLTTEYRINPVLDEKTTAAFLSGVWNLSGADNIFYNIGISRNDFLDPSFDREDEDKTATVTYFHSIKRNVNINIEVAKLNRVSTVESESYDDLRVIMSLTYNSL